MLILPTALLAVVSTAGLFFFSTGQLILQSFRAIEVRLGIPLSYTFTPNYPRLDWFYFPTNILTLLGVVTLVASFGLIAYGRRISKTPMNLRRGLASYLLYGLVAPFWLIRSAADVMFGVQRTWK